MITNKITLWWLIGRSIAFRLKGSGFESRSRDHLGTLGKSFTRSCLWHLVVKLRHSIRALSGAPLSKNGLAEALFEITSMNECLSCARCSLILQKDITRGRMEGPVQRRLLPDARHGSTLWHCTDCLLLGRGRVPAWYT